MNQPGKVKPRTILVVDDEVSICSILEDMLRDKGFDVISAYDGDQALEVFRNQDLDMVLTDINMPRLDGLAVLRAIKESKPSTPVVMMSGRADMQDVIAAMDRGAQNFLLKPIRVNELYRVVDRLELALAANPLGGDRLSLAKIQKVCFESPSRPDYVRGLLNQMEQCASMMVATRGSPMALSLRFMKRLPMPWSMATSGMKPRIYG
jgi:DNA-binding NtrC family response regulator